MQFCAGKCWPIELSAVPVFFGKIFHSQSFPTFILSLLLNVFELDPCLPKFKSKGFAHLSYKGIV